MILVCIDETGDTGTNLTDPQQPIFVLGAILIKQDQWKSLEDQFRKILRDYFNGVIPEDFELHTIDLVSRRGFFKKATLEETFQLRDKLLTLLVSNTIPLYYRKIEKKKYARFCDDNC